MTRKKTLEQFIADADPIHKWKYGYSKVVYISSKDKVIITCPKHGDFLQRPNDHLMGKGCERCGKESSAIKATKDTETFVAEADRVHNGKYNYNLVVYIKSHQKVKIVCPIHDMFEQTPSEHLSGKGCPKCSGFCKTTEEFIKESNAVHNNRYTYERTVYAQNRYKVIITCGIHGDFLQTPNKHLRGRCCHKCARYGYNKNKIGSFYIYKTPLFIGFGITNKLNNRKGDHRRTFTEHGIEYEFLGYYTSDGSVIEDLERSVKREFDIVNTGVRGFKTEAVAVSDLQNLLDFVEDYLK